MKAPSASVPTLMTVAVRIPAKNHREGQRQLVLQQDLAPGHPHAGGCLD
jgi:hypothetical protein